MLVLNDVSPVEVSDINVAFCVDALSVRTVKAGQLTKACTG